MGGAGAAGLAALGATLAVVLPSSPRGLGLPPTGTVAYASGCRDDAGNRGPCASGALYCTQALVSTGPLQYSYPTTVNGVRTQALTTTVGTVTSPGCDIEGQPRRETDPTPGCPANTMPDRGADEYYGPGCEPHGLLSETIVRAGPLMPTGVKPVYALGISWAAPPKVLPAGSPPVAKYYVYLNGVLKSRLAASARSWVGRVACGTTVYQLTVAAADADGNVSEQVARSSYQLGC